MIVDQVYYCIALEEYASNLNKNTWWPLLIEGLTVVGSGHFEYKFYLVTLINVLTNSGFLELEDRVFVRNTLESFKIDQVFHQLEKDCQKVKQTAVIYPYVSYALFQIFCVLVFFLVALGAMIAKDLVGWFVSLAPSIFRDYPLSVLMLYSVYNASYIKMSHIIFLLQPTVVFFILFTAF